MEQKTKVISLAAILIILVAGLGIYVAKKNKHTVSAPQAMSTSQEGQPVASNDLTAPAPSQAQQPQSQTQATTISGKVHSMNEKQVYLDLDGGKGSAINISATTPVHTQGSDKTGNLSILKIGASVTVSVDANNNATDIVIKG